MIDFSYVIILELGVIIGWCSAKLEFRVLIKKDSQSCDIKGGASPKNLEAIQMKKLMSILVLSLLSIGAFAASVSNTHYSGTSFSNSFSVGGSVDQSSYIGGSIAIESAQGAFSITKDIYIGSDTATSNYIERTRTATSFNGDVTSNGLVATSSENSSSISRTRGGSIDTASGHRVGAKLEYSSVGGAVGGEATLYSNSYSNLTVTGYGSNVYSDTYSSSSYGI